MACRPDYCFGHMLAESRPAVGHPEGTLRVILFDADGAAVEAKIAKSQRGAHRIMDNWAKRRGRPVRCPAAIARGRA